jgi:glycosyltransferase involved in cell wall biosynthesis
MTGQPTVSTAIVCYNQEAFIGAAIDSALAQRGNFVQEIIVSDDGSSDNTRQIIGGLSDKHWKLIRDLSSDRNVGVSANYKRCFDAANGDYIAVLEGDDYWFDELKLQYQVDFLENNPDCSMVFSKIRVENLGNRTVRTLRRQEDIRGCKLDGSDFLAHETMNLIGNFSCCMFRTELIRKLPEFLFETRISEVMIAFFLENFGQIGFINRPMSAYRQHAGGVWSGASREEQFAGHLDMLRKSQAVARDAYKDRIQSKIKEFIGEAESVG